MNKIDFLVFHHSGGLGGDPYVSTKNLTAEHIDNAHRLRWPNFISQMGWFIGYTGLIFPSGEILQTRLVGEETAAVKGSNKISSSWCVLGNFTFNKDLDPVDYPTKEQIRSIAQIEEAYLNRDFKKLGLKIALNTEINVQFKNIVPHRVLQLTDCYGNVLDNIWGRDLYIRYLHERISLIERLILQIIDARRRMRTSFDGMAMKLGAKVEPCWESNNRD